MNNPSKTGSPESLKRSGGLLSRLALAGVLAAAACKPNLNPPDHGQEILPPGQNALEAIKAYLSKMLRAKNDSALATRINQLRIFKTLQKGDQGFDEYVEAIRRDDGFQFNGAQPSDVVRIVLLVNTGGENVANAVAFNASGEVVGWGG